MSIEFSLFMFNMYQILERTIDYGSEEHELILTHYWLFKVNYHNWELSSVDSEEPVDWWYDSPDEIIKKHSDVTIDSEIKDYQQTLLTIHENCEKLYWLIDEEC